MQTLPPNRQRTKLGKFAELQNGFAFSSKKFKDTGTPIIRISNLQKGEISLKRIVYCHISDYEKDLSKYIVKKGDLMIAMSGATTGKLAFNNLETEFLLNQRVGLFRCENDVTKKYLYLYLSTRIQYNLNQSAGSAIPNLSTKQIKEIQIPLPPLTTQQAIVAKLDEAMASIAAAKAGIYTQIEQVDELWNAESEKLFGGDFEKVNLTGVVDFVSETCLPIDGELYNYIGLENIVSNTGEIIGSIESNGKTIKSTKVCFEKGDILYGKLRPYLNKTVLAEFDGIATTEILPMRCKSVINNAFLSYYLRTQSFVDEANASTSGARMPRVTKSFLLSFEKVPLPTLEQQQQIVAHIDSIQAHCNTLRSSYTSQLAHYDDLQASILDQAFSGKLVA